MARKSDDSGISVEAAAQSLKERKFAKIYLFYGEEDFLIDELADLLVDQAIEPSERSFNLDIVSGAELDAKAIASLALAYPMMGERRVVVVRSFDKLANKELLSGVIERPVESTILALCCAAKLDFRLKVSKTLRAQATIVNCAPLYDNQIAPWIAQRIRKLGKRASPEACQAMQAYVSRSLREIQNEIDKLFIYVGEKNEITVDDVNQVVGMSKLWNVYELQRTVGMRDTARSLEIGQRMMEAGESPIYAIVALTKYFQKLWHLPELAARCRSEEELAGAIGAPKFFLNEYRTAAQRYGPTDVERCFGLLRDADLQMKTSSPDPGALMTSLLYGLTAVASASVAL